MAQSSAKLNEVAKDIMTRDFGLPHRDSSDGRSIEFPIAIDKSVAQLADNNSRTDATKVKGFSLIPQEPLAELARVYQIGADKYAPRGWEKGMPFSEVVDGLYRHLGQWLRGEKFDAADGQHHLASVAWRAFALMEYERTHPEMDDVHA